MSDGFATGTFRPKDILTSCLYTYPFSAMKKIL